jgi:hypothetical protein
MEEDAMATKNVNDVAAELADILRSSGNKMVTMAWPEFYDINNMKRFANGRHELLRQACMAQGIIIGLGNHAIMFTHDSNHSPA